MDFRIPRSSADGLDGAKFFWALIEPVWPDSSVEDELAHVALATPGQRALYVVTLCIREVDNGGFEQFFYNSSGMYADEVRKGLRLLNAIEHATAFEKALKVFPGARAPIDQEERQGILESIPRARRKAIFQPLQEKFFGEERIWPYFQEYVDTHPSEFFSDDFPADPGTRKRRRGK